MRYRSRGHVSLPVVIRIPCAGGTSTVEHHSESPEAIFTHTAGLRVVACADRADAFAMIHSRSNGVADALPFDRAKTLLEGTDVPLLGYGPLVRTCADSAIAAREDGRSIEVIDLRSLSPRRMPPCGRCGAAFAPCVRRTLADELAPRIGTLDRGTVHRSSLG